MLEVSVTWKLTNPIYIKTSRNLSNFYLVSSNREREINEATLSLIIASVKIKLIPRGRQVIYDCEASLASFLDKYF